MKTTVTYTGPLASGYVQCPNTLKSYPFKNGAAFDLPETLASNLYYQSKEHWSVLPEIQKIAEKRLADEIAAAEKAAKEKEKPAPVTETASTDENTEEKV